MMIILTLKILIYLLLVSYCIVWICILKMIQLLDILLQIIFLCLQKDWKPTLRLMKMKQEQLKQGQLLTKEMLRLN
ncbi:hypothetical protein RhiirA4_97746 [Rhizophagus irregularis]|uniref:Uncharacterized protein n=1 Tax=Rhizophagus irregularis TaxID=588596 RepID=A0A2I1HBV3_9GLOM|nr:hypothetical protein RhiirA4_97746 [Rhizophagus irregularis]